MRNIQKITDKLDRMQNKGQWEQGAAYISFLLQKKGEAFSRDAASCLLSKQGYFLLFCGRIAEAAAAYLEAVRVAPQIEHKRMYYSGYLMASHYLLDISDEELAECHFAYNQFFRSEDELQHDREEHRRHEKIRLGYLSGSFKDHVTSCFLMQLLALADRSRFEIYCYDESDMDDAAAVQMKDLGHTWRNLASSGTREKAEAIQADGIDILFELGGHTDGGRGLAVLGYKPAPVQITGIGYMSTSGLRAVDYYLTDVFLDPPGVGEAYFSEKLLRLSRSHFCYTPFETIYKASIDWQPHQPLVFGCFNNSSKISDEMLRLWLEILRCVPDSRLLLKSWTPKAMRKRALAVGYRPQEIEVREMTLDYVHEYMDMDIALDTYPYTGGGTTCEALYMGVPVVTLAGTRHGARFGLSLLENVGLGELAAQNEQGYIERAVALARDRELLAALHTRLRPMMQVSPLMDGRGYVREMETAYEQIWEKWLG